MTSSFIANPAAIALFIKILPLHVVIHSELIVPRLEDPDSAGCLSKVPDKDLNFIGLVHDDVSKNNFRREHIYWLRFADQTYVFMRGVHLKRLINNSIRNQSI